MARQYLNSFSTTIQNNITDSQTFLHLTDTTGLTSLTGSDYYYMTLDDGTNREIVRITVINLGNGFCDPIVRAQDGSTAYAFTADTSIEIRATKASFDDLTDSSTNIVTSGSVTAATLSTEASGSITMGAVNILTDSAGTTTLNNIDALDATTIATIDAAITTELSTDTTPVLGGNLDVSTHEIISTSTNPIDLHSNADVNITLGDAAGTNVVNIKDSGGATVFTINSNGELVFPDAAYIRYGTAAGAAKTRVETKTIADDGIATFTNVRTALSSGRGLYFLTCDYTTDEMGIFTANSIFNADKLAGLSNVSFVTTPVTGTTGVDGTVTISIELIGGAQAFTIENRLGQGVKFAVMSFIGA